MEGVGVGGWGGGGDEGGGGGGGGSYEGVKSFGRGSRGSCGERGRTSMQLLQVPG